MSLAVFRSRASALWDSLLHFLDLRDSEAGPLMPADELIWALSTTALRELLETAAEVGKEGLDDVLIDLWAKRTTFGQMTFEEIDPWPPTTSSSP